VNVATPTKWKFIHSFADGERFEFVPGHNIWDYKWTSVMRDPPRPPTGDQFKDDMAKYERATVIDPIYGAERIFSVYDATVEGRTVRFACSEFSNGIFGYYVPDES
jgi:hypothetical protein